MQVKEARHKSTNTGWPHLSEVPRTGKFTDGKRNGICLGLGGGEMGEWGRGAANGCSFLLRVRTMFSRDCADGLTNP